MVSSDGLDGLAQPQPIVYMTRMEVAHYLNVSLRTIDRYAIDGRLTRYRKVNQHVRYDRKEVVALALFLPEQPRRQR